MDCCCRTPIAKRRISRPTWLVPLLGGVLLVGVSVVAVTVLVGAMPGYEDLGLAPLRGDTARPFLLTSEVPLDAPATRVG